MDRTLAENISTERLACSGKLDASVAVLQGSVNEELFNRYRRQAGQIMGLIYIDILRDLYSEHPELEPESMKGDGDLAVADNEATGVAAARELISQAQESLERLQEYFESSNQIPAESSLETLAGARLMTDQLIDLIAS